MEEMHTSHAQNPRTKKPSSGTPQEEVHEEVLDTENMEHGCPSRSKRDNHHHREDQSAVPSVAGHHHMKTGALSQALLATIITKTRALQVNTGNSSLKTQ